MKKYICILAGTACMLAACEQKSETVNPPSDQKTENNTTVVNPTASPATSNSTETNTTINTTTTATPSSESSTTTTTTSPAPTP